MKVLFTKDYGKEKFDKIRELGYEIMYYNAVSYTHLRAHETT